MNPYLLISDLAEEVRPPTEGMVSHTLFNDENVKVLILGFAAGHQFAAHSAPMPVTIQFLQGDAMLTLGEETHAVAGGALIHIQPRLTHGIVAKTPVLILLTMFKAARG